MRWGRVRLRRAGRAAAGSAPPAGSAAGGEQLENLENTLCVSLDIVISEDGGLGFPPPALNF